MISRAARFILFLTLGMSLSATAAELTSTLTPTATSYPTGTRVTFRNTFQNNGPGASAATEATMQFTSYSGNVLATDIQVVGTSPGLTCSGPVDLGQGPKITCTSAALAQGFAGFLDVAATLTGTTGNMEACASIKPDPGEANVNNNFSCVPLTLTVPQSDTSATLTPTTTSFPTGTRVTYTSLLRNSGPDAAANGSVSIQFTALNGNINATDIQVVAAPAGLTCSGPTATPQGPIVTCTTPSLAVGYEGTLQVAATLTGTSGQMNVCARSGPASSDPNTANNAACANITVTVPHADLALTSLASTTGNVSAGTTLTYTNTVRNDGPDTATNASHRVQFTSLNGTIGVQNIQVVSTPAEFTCGSATATPQGPVITCTAASVANGYSGQFVVSAQVTGTSGQMNVCNSVTSATDDPDTLDNSVCFSYTGVAAQVVTTGLSCPGTTITAGNGGTATVTIAPAQGTPTIISLASSKTAAATVPPSVVVQAGQTSATFTITGVTAGMATITATGPASLGGTTATCNTTVTGSAGGPAEVPTLSPLTMALMAIALGTLGYFVTRA